MPNVRRNNAEKPTEKPSTESRDRAKAINLRARRDKRHSGSTLNLSSMDAETLKRTLIAVLEREVGITFGITRDGGALSITLLDNGETVREYVRATEDINAYFTGLADDFGDSQ